MSNTSLLGSYGDNSGAGLMFRNVLVNGNFDVWQRATSQTTTGYGSADRWKFDVLTNITAARQPAAAPYGIFSMLLTPSSATNSFVMAQTIEDNQLVGLKGKAATVSFSANAASGTQTVTLYLQKSATANDSTGGGGGWVTISSLVCSITNAVQTFTMTALVPNDGTANGLRVAFGGTNTASGVGIALWGVQLEAGPTATPFERRPIGVELALCQRYYEKFQSTTGACFASEITDSANRGGGALRYLVEKRAIPTIEFTAAANYKVYQPALNGQANATVTCVAVTSYQPNTKTVRLLFTTASGISLGAATECSSVNTDGTIGINAEL